jgi:hypothetical protein
MAEISELERSETLMERFAAEVRDRGGPDLYEPVLDILTERMGQRLGLDRDGPSGSADGRRIVDEAADRLADEADGQFTRALAESHALGWFHQHFGAPERKASHRAHNENEAKHDSQTTTTQLYTPRWIADVLAAKALSVADGGEGEGPTVLDPAVGGGQFLLAAYDALARRHTDAEPRELVDGLYGVDVDARAAEVARRVLKLHVARRTGKRRPEAEARIDERIGVADGLFDDLPDADVVLTNPPYMGSRSMPDELKSRVWERYEPFHGDLYAAFIRRCHELANDCVGVLAQQTIWYLKRFERARQELLDEGLLELFVHFGPHAFASLSGEKANVVGFVQRSGDRQYAGQSRFVDLRDLGDPEVMRGVLVEELEEGGGRSRQLDVERLSVIPGRPVSYWLPAELRRHFDGGRRLGDVAEVPGRQNKTGANRQYVRTFREVPAEAVEWRPLYHSPTEAPTRIEPDDQRRWFFYSKGGRYAPWWGNWENVVDWSAEAREYYANNRTSNLVPERYQFREGICYTDFGGTAFNARWMPAGCLFDMAGPAIFPTEAASEDDESVRQWLFALLAVLNTTPVQMLLNALNPSIHYQVTDLRRLPLPVWDAETGGQLADLAVDQIEDLRRLARPVEASPVGGGPSGGGATLDTPSVETVAAVGERVAGRTDRLDAVVWELYGGEAADAESLRDATHHYIEKLRD